MIQDLHLAKRYYDQAAEVDTKARVPRDLALMVLEVSSHFPCTAIVPPRFVSDQCAHALVF